KRNSGEIEHARGPLPPAVGPPADVAVRGDEAATLVEGLLLQDTVEADDLSSCAPERAVEQRAPDPAARQVRADDEKPDERVSLAIERARGGGRDSPTSRPSPITSASLSCTSTPRSGELILGQLGHTVAVRHGGRLGAAADVELVEDARHVDA